MRECEYAPHTPLAAKELRERIERTWSEHSIMELSFFQKHEVASARRTVDLGPCHLRKRVDGRTRFGQRQDGG
jgi:hypothetical protein